MPNVTLPVEAPLRSGRPDVIERPVVFHAGAEELSGVYCERADAVASRGVVLLTGGGFIASMHRNRTWVRLSRRLAAAGWGVLRFDYHGVGESTGEVTKFWLDQPFAQDVEGAVQWMRDQGVAPVALVGSCFGARTALGVADRIPELEGAALISVPLFGKTLAAKARRAMPRWWRVLAPAWRTAYLRIARARFERIIGLRRGPGRTHSAMVDGRRGRLTHAPGAVPRGLRWISPRFLEDLRRILARPVRVLMLYGTEEDYYLEFRRALGQGLDRILGRAATTVDVRTADGVLHGFATLAMQEFTIASIVEWLGTPLHDTRSARAARGAATPSRTAGEEHA